jgi:transmembrane sensor
MGSSEAELTDFARIGAKIREALDDADPLDQIRAAREALLDWVALRNANGMRHGMRQGWLHRTALARGRTLALCGAMAVAVAVGIVWLRLPISFRVSAADAPGRLGDMVEAGGPDPVALWFSEGSSIVLGTGSRVRVLSAEPTGARVLIESGAVDVAIVHRERRGTRWRFEAGPLHILVTGTKFRAAWRPEDQSFALETKEGSVVVSGACLPAARTVSGGQSLHLSCPAAGRLASSSAARPLTAPSVEAPASSRSPAPLGEALAAPPSERPAAPVSSPASAARGAVDWRELVASGRYSQGLRVAERVGFARVCRSSNEEELLSLADAARLSGRTSRAIEALGLLRQRFPHSSGAATAAFALGRIAFERRGAYGEAALWFGTYLDEMPSGPLAGDAAGRLMEARQRGGDGARARADAERYLHRFPEGPYAVAARAILTE